MVLWHSSLHFSMLLHVDVPDDVPSYLRFPLPFRIWRGGSSPSSVYKQTDMVASGFLTDNPLVHTRLPYTPNVFVTIPDQLGLKQQFCPPVAYMSRCSLTLANLSARDRICNLMFDEMNLTSIACYDQQRDQVCFNQCW